MRLNYALKCYLDLNVVDIERASVYVSQRSVKAIQQSYLHSQTLSSF